MTRNVTKRPNLSLLKSHQNFDIRTKKIAAHHATHRGHPRRRLQRDNYRIADYVRDYSHLKKGETLPEKEIRMGLRVMTQRSASNALHFYVCMYTAQDTASYLTMHRQGRGCHHPVHVPIAGVQGRRAL